MAAVESRSQAATTGVSIRTRGAVLGGAGLALLLAGLWRVDGTMAAAGLAAWVLLGMAFLAARRNGRDLGLALECPGRVEAGMPFPVRLLVANPHRWLDAFGLEVELDLARAARETGRIRWLVAGSTAAVDFRMTIPGRMIATRHRVIVRSRFPLGLFLSVRESAVEARLVVVPRPVVPRGLVFSAGPLDMHDDDPMTATGGPGEPRGLREWRAGDPMKRVNWPASLRSFARGAGWVVLETDPPGFRPARFAVVVHSHGGDRQLIRPDRFERTMSHAAGVLRMLHTQGMPARLIADFDDWTPRAAAKRNQLADCMERLAGARRANGTEAHDLQAALADITPDEGIVILSDMPVASWRYALPASLKRALTPDIAAGRAGKGARA